MKICWTCDQNLPESEFYKNRSRKDGLRRDCKMCHKAKVRAWQIANPDKKKKTAARYRESHRETIRECGREYIRYLQKTNPERIRKPSREWGCRNRDKTREGLRRYRATEKGRLAHIESEARRRAKIKHRIPPEDLVWIIDRYGGRCIYCGGLFQALDHFEPLAGEGDHTIGNLVPACSKCNASKHKSDPVVWMERVGVDLSKITAAVSIGDRLSPRPPLSSAAAPFGRWRPQVQCSRV